MNKWCKESSLVNLPSFKQGLMFENKSEKNEDKILSASEIWADNIELGYIKDILARIMNFGGINVIYFVG